MQKKMAYYLQYLFFDDFGLRSPVIQKTFHFRPKLLTTSIVARAFVNFGFGVSDYGPSQGKMKTTIIIFKAGVRTAPPRGSMFSRWVVQKNKNGED